METKFLATKDRSISTIVGLKFHQTKNLVNRVGETNIKSSDPNSEPQGITNYDFELPCKISDHSDQFGLGPHPPLWERE